MTQHARPLPSPPTPGLPHLVRPPSRPEPASRPAPPIDERPNAHPTEPRDAPAAGTGEIDPSAPDVPWYRSESWLAVALGALVPIMLAIAIPGWQKLALLGLGGSMTVLGFLMLVRRERTLRAGARPPHPARPVQPPAY